MSSTASVPLVVVLTCCAGFGAGLRAQDNPHEPVLRDVASLLGAPLVPRAQPDRPLPVADFELDTVTGRLAGLVVAVPQEEATVLVARRWCAFRPETKTFEVLADDLKILAQPRVVLERLPLPVPPAEGSEKKDPPRLPRHVAATSLVGLPVTVAGRGVGTVEEVVADMLSGDLAFLGVGLVDADGKPGPHCWVPWRSCRIRRDGSGITVKVPGGDLGAAPAHPSDSITDPLYRAKLYEFFEVEPPAFERR